MKALRSSSCARALILFLITIGAAYGAEEVSDASVADSMQMFRHLNAGNAALEHKAVAILIFPRVGKGERRGLNSEYGEGVLQINGTAAGQFSIQTPTRSPTLGVAYHRLVLLFMTDDALHHFQQSKKWVAGLDTGVAIAAAGRHGTYNTSELKKPILGFVYGEEGLFDNLYLQGCVIRPLSGRLALALWRMSTDTYPSSPR